MYDRSNVLSFSIFKEFGYVQKMWKLVARRNGDAVYGRRIPLGPRWSVGPFLWAGRDQTGAAVDARGRSETRIRVDEGTGNEVGRHLQGERGGRSEEHTSELQSRVDLVCR